MLCSGLPCVPAHMEAAIGEELDCYREYDNHSDRYAVAVVKSDTIVGHLPRKLSRVFSLLIRRGGVIRCHVAGRRRCSRDLPQGGMEIPCILIIRAEGKDLHKLKRLWKT